MSRKRIKQISISLLLGIILTLAIGGFKFFVLDKPHFNPFASCNEMSGQARTLCEPSSPYLQIGFPWHYGMYSDASGSYGVMHFTSSPLEYEGQAAGDYAGFIADALLYTSIIFAAVLLVSRLKRR
jgi:hypothetical protein